MRACGQLARLTGTGEFGVEDLNRGRERYRWNRLADYISRSSLRSLELKVDLRRLEERRSQSAANTPDDAATAHDLASCVRAYARLGEVDAGVPMAKQLFSIVTGDKRFSQQHQAEAANYLGMLAYQCLNEDRLDEALVSGIAGEPLVRGSQGGL